MLAYFYHISKQASQYDKIFRENLEAVTPGLMQTVLGITAVATEELPDDIQHTKERKPDVLKKVTDEQGATFVLHLEFQVADEPEMVYRMADYYVMLARKYELSVEQYVIYLGAAKPQMPTQLVSNWMKYTFRLISFAELDYHVFLRASRPEEIVLGVLADFKGNSPEKALEQIIRRIKETTAGDFPLKRYFQQLRVLAQLRSLGDNLKDIAMDSIAKFVSMEKDAFYMIAQEQEQVKFVTNLLQETDFPVERVAKIADVSVEFVKNVQQKLPTDK